MKLRAPLREVTLCFVLTLAACGAENAAATDGGAPDGGGGTGGSVSGTPATFNVFTAIPQFGVYVMKQPDYTPPPGVLMWSYGTEFVTQLTPMDQASIGSDLAARITFIAQCDNYDRLGGLFFLSEPKGQAPEPTDARTEIVRFITPFSDYTQGALATHVYPDADLSAFAEALADPTHDVWIGIAGGSNPYSGDPCTGSSTLDFAAVGFKYTVDFVSTKPLTLAPSVVLPAVSDLSETSVPITGTLMNPGSSPLPGHLTVIVSGHGSGAGGDEYEHTMDQLSLNGAMVGSFSTEIDCAPYAKWSPDGNPGIFQGNTSGNPRNWCPGAPVLSHTFAATLTPGSNIVSLGITPSAVPSGSYYATSITFTSP